MARTPVWQRKAGQDPDGGLNEAGRRSLRAEGRDIKRPVTKAEARRSPAKAKRRIAFCRRSAGQMKMWPEAAKDPNSRLRLARKKWDC